jgi:hypothetical protein
VGHADIPAFVLLVLAIYEKKTPIFKLEDEVRLLLSQNDFSDGGLSKPAKHSKTLLHRRLHYIVFAYRPLGWSTLIDGPRRFEI